MAWEMLLPSPVSVTDGWRSQGAFRVKGAVAAEGERHRVQGSRE